MSIIGTIATAAIAIAVPGGIVGLVLKFGAKEALKRAGDVATYLIAHPMTAVAGVAGLVALFYWQDARHWEKANTGHVATLGAVKAEVDRGVCLATPKGQKCKPTDAANAPAYVRSFVDNLETVKGELDHQTALVNAAKTDANKHDDDAHQAAQPTADQRAREKVRQALKDPARVDGADTDWGKL